MSWATAIIDGVANTYHYGIQKFRTPRRAPRYLQAEVGETPLGVPSDFWGGLSQHKKQLIASRVSWIYSNIFRISNEVSAAKFQVLKFGSKEQDIEHDFERLLEFPNEFFTGKDLLSYIVWGLSLDRWGAFWYLAPDSKTGGLREIWPIPLGRMRPIKDRNRYIKGYVYTPRKHAHEDELGTDFSTTSGTGEPFFIPEKFVCRFLYPHPFDLYRSLPPLDASTLAIDTYAGISTTQRDLFTQSRGVPLSVLSLDENISEPDFAVARQRIRDDWENERKIAIIRGGTMDVQTIGLSNRAMQVIESSSFNRDQFDAIFMGGIQWRRDDISGEERDTINKEIKEVVIRPIHELIAARVQISILSKFYGPDFVGDFEDVRAQDRAIQIQENQVNWTGKTFDEARRDLKLPEYKEESLPGLGNLPVRLATNPSFVLQYFDIASTPDPEENPEEVGNLIESQDPEQLTNQMVEQPEKAAIDIESAINEGIKEELKRYQKVLLRTWRKREEAQDLIDRQFDSDIIFEDVFINIQTKLISVSSEEDIKAIFAEWLN
jgi:hypothetical protein